MNIKIKNEKTLKTNIQEKQDELNSCLSELENVKSKTKECRQNIYNSENQLSAIDHGNDSAQLHDADEAMRAADLKTARRKELADIISSNQGCIESLVKSESNLSIKISGLKEPLRSAREAYCLAFEEAVKATSEWKKVQESISHVKALWFETFSGSVFVEDVISDLGLHEQPVEFYKEKARAELLIK